MNTDFTSRPSESLKTVINGPLDLSSINKKNLVSSSESVMGSTSSRKRRRFSSDKSEKSFSGDDKWAERSKTGKTSRHRASVCQRIHEETRALALLQHRDHLSMEEDKELKKLRRKQKNREAAQNSRNRKKLYVEGLERKMERVESENTDLKFKMEKMEKYRDAVESENGELKSRIRALENILHAGPGTDDTIGLVSPVSQQSSPPLPPLLPETPAVPLPEFLSNVDIATPVIKQEYIEPECVMRPSAEFNLNTVQQSHNQITLIQLIIWITLNTTSKVLLQVRLTVLLQQANCLSTVMYLFHQMINLSQKYSKIQIHHQTIVKVKRLSPKILRQHRVQTRFHAITEGICQWTTNLDILSLTPYWMKWMTTKENTTSHTSFTECTDAG